MSKKITKYLKIILIAIFSVWFTSGCIDDNFNLTELSTHIENEGEWEFKVINTTFLIEDLLDIIDTTGFVSSDEEGLILLVYSDTAYTATAREEIVFPDQSYDTLFNEQDYQNAGGFVGGTVTMTKANINYLFIAAAANQLLDSVLLESSFLDINVSSTFNYQGNVTITIPDLKKDGQAYQKVIPINDNSGNFSSNNTYNDLEGYTLDFTNFATPNNFFITYELTLVEGPGSGPIEPTDICDIDVQFREIQYEYIWGYLGTQTFDVPEQQFVLDFFQSFDFEENGSFELYDPRIRVKVANSFGLSVGVCMPTLQLKLQDDTWADIVGPAVPTDENPWIITSPEPSYPSPINPKNAMFLLSGSGTNLGELVSELPKQLRFNQSVKLNPDEDEQRTNFMSKNSRMEAIVDFEVPLWLRTEGINYVDTMEMDLDAMSEDLSIIDYIDLNLSINNGLPHALGFKAYLTDSLYNIIDSIPNGNDSPLGDTLWIVESGLLGPDSVVNQETEKTLSETTIRYEYGGVDIFENVKNMIINVKYITTDGNSTNSPYVKYFNFYEMDFDVNLQVKLDFNSEDDQ